MQEKTEASAAPVAPHGTQEEPGETGVPGRPKVQPVSGIVVHGVMYLALSRYER